MDHVAFAVQQNISVVPKNTRLDGSHFFFQLSFTCLWLGWGNWWDNKRRNFVQNSFAPLKTLPNCAGHTPWWNIPVRRADCVFWFDATTPHWGSFRLNRCRRKDTKFYKQMSCKITETNGRQLTCMDGSTKEPVQSPISFWTFAATETLRAPDEDRRHTWL